LNDKILHTLEFAKVRERLASYTSFSGGRALALELEPSNDIAQVQRFQRITTQAVRLLSLRPEVTIGGARDVRELARRASLGSLLDPEDILLVKATLAASRNLRNLVVFTAEQKGGLDLLRFIADGITLLPKLESEIERCINDDGEVLDSASPKLANLRSSIRGAHARLMSKLQQIIQSDTYSRALQEPIITLRDGRYVVPVKRDFQGQLRGIVHDQSNTGSTLFVEPLAVVDLGNEWRQLQMEEAQEIERIMAELGALIGAQADAIITNVEITADLDLALAKGRYSLALHAVEPGLVDIRRKAPTDNKQRPPDNRVRHHNRNTQAAVSGQPTNPSTQSAIHNPQSAVPQERGLYFKNARHPLLTGTVVPITVELGDPFRILVITGPNTGGKTVALKTVGLLTLMAQAGLHVPADYGSRAIVFKDVFADIGDEQSIEQSLSTFSSHMSNIVRILKQADRESLVLLDELGAGTDPQEGSALARSIITHILEVGSLAVCTTHYSELKAFAFTTQGVENASVEFDINTLSPTYRLMIGVPGRSNALAIANRLGLSHTVIDRARRFINPEDQRVEDLMEDIRTAREAARQEHGSAERTRRDIERRNEELERQLAEIEDIKTRAAEDARAEFERELDSLRAELRQLRGRVEAGLAATSDEALTRQWVTQAQARAEEMDRQIRVRAQEQRKERNRANNRPRTKVVDGEPDKPHVFGPGDVVLVRNMGAEGDVLGPADSGGQIEVQVGAFKMRVPMSNLVLRRTASAAAASREAASSAAGRYASAAPRSAPPLEYDFRGWRAEEAIEEMDKRLDEAAMAGMPFLRIIHGKGTGALRKAMREYLKGHPSVKELETPPDEQGGAGVTIVKL
jgi:DNA mismatch repair protein MutS2